MASRDYYVDAAAGADTNGGTSGGAAIVADLPPVYPWYIP